MKSLLVQDEDEMGRNIKKTGVVRKLEQSTKRKLTEGWISVLAVEIGRRRVESITLGDLEWSPNPNVISEGKRARKGR